MKEINLLSDSELVVDLKESVAKEKQATLEVIERLGLIAERRIHLSLGYSSLHEFAVVELGYSDGSAYRRIQAMKLCSEVPESKKAISDGSITLCVASALMDHMNRVGKTKLTSEAKLELLEKVRGKSKRECERLLNPEQNGERVQFVADEETMNDLRRLSELLSIPEREMSALIKKIARVARAKLDPAPKKAAPPVKLEKSKTASPAKLITRNNRPHTKSWIKSTVWERDEGRCSYISQVSGRRCTSRFGIQEDHITPVALGGPSTVDNLRLLCPAHNRLEAERIFGREKMDQYARKQN